MKASTAGSALKRATAAEQVGLVADGGDVAVHGQQAAALAHLVLLGDVPATGRVVADQDRAEPDRPADRGQLGDPSATSAKTASATGAPGMSDPAAHQCWNCRSPVKTMAMPCSSAAAIDLVVAERPAGLDDRGHPGGGHGVEAVAEREEGVAGRRPALGPAGGPLGRDLARGDPVLLAAADADGHAAGGQHDGVGLDPAHTRQASSRSRHCSSVGAALVTTRQSARPVAKR